MNDTKEITAKNAPRQRKKNTAKRIGFAVGEGSCATVAPGHAKANPGINGPFALDEKLGLYFVEGGKRQRVCPPLRVKGYVIDCDGKNAAILVSFKNMLGRQTTLDLPLEVVNKGEHMLALLTRNGMTLDTDNPKTRATAIKLYLQSNCPNKITFVRVVSNGWQRMPDGSEVYVYGHNVYGQPSSRYEAVQTAVFVEPPSAGTREEWFHLLKPLARDPLAVLAVSAAFAAPLLKPLNFGTLALFFVGPSSTGKTILLKLVASVFGSPTSLLTWEGTENGIEAQALKHRDKPMVTDEVGQASGKQFSALSYRLMNPASKQRATSSGQAVEVQQTRTVIISSGEITPIDRMTEAGEVAKQGQIARLVTLPVSQEYGVWSIIEGFANGADKSHHVLTQIQSVHGRAGREFCRSIAPEIDDIAADYAAVASDLAEAIFPSNQLAELDGVPRRVLQNFVLFAFSGMLAIKKKVLPWTDHQVLQAAKRGFALWLADYQQHKQPQGSELLTPVRLFLQSHRSHKFKPLSAWGDVHEGSVAGFFHVKRNGQRYFLVFPAYFAKHMCGDQSPKKVLDALRSAGFLEPGPRGVPTQQVGLPGSENLKSSFYAIKQSILHE